MARPIASVIISAKNEAPRLAECVASLAAQKSRFPFEVHLVDNGSTDGTYAKARKLTAELKNFHVWKEKKPGSPAARNFGARKAQGKVLLFTDADCVLSPRWVEEMARPLLEPGHYPLAAVGGKTESAFQAKGRPNLWEQYLDGLFQFWEEDRLAAFPAFLPWAPTCNLAVKAEVFHALKGFDERWRSAGYDVDFCWRLAVCGFVLGYAPKASLKHKRRHTLRGLLRQMENYAFYNHALLSTYQKELRLPVLGTQKERLLSRSRRILSLARSTKTFSDASHRGIDTLVGLAALKGALEARLLAPQADPRFSRMRRGLTPDPVKRLLSRGYSHLHQQGWVYWKHPATTAEEGDLVLLRPKSSERFRLNHTAWKIWEIKAENGQSEDAAEALGQSPDDQEVLEDIDQLTIDLRTRRLLP